MNAHLIELVNPIHSHRKKVRPDLKTYFDSERFSNRGCSIKLDLGFIVRKRGDSTFLQFMWMILAYLRIADSVSASRAFRILTA